jgi:ASPIC and UnbV
MGEAPICCATTGAIDRTRCACAFADARAIGKVLARVRVHFGHDRAAAIDRLEVRWPGGRVESLKNLPAQQDLTIVDGAGVAAQHPLIRR